MLEPALDRSEDVALRTAHAGARACMDVKKDGAFKTLHDGGDLVRAKMRLEVRKVIDRARLTNAGSAPISRATLLHAASIAAMESVMFSSCKSCVCMRVKIQRDARWISKRATSKRAASAKEVLVILCMRDHAAPMSGGFKVGGRGSSDADYGLRDGIEMEEKAR